MSSEEEIKKSLNNDSESFCESTKSSKFAYSRDFLLSLSDLDICKKLPDGFDSSLLSEFEVGYHGPQDRPRNPGSLPLQSHRRTDYSSSPPTRGDSSNYSRGVYGRWDNRSSGRSDRDGESQLDKDSDSGRPYGNQYRKPWQSSEHDGLLGSGSFARPPGFVAGLSGPKGRSNDQYQLKRTSEPYQPPRPYKAGPLSRREITDSLNDETFGSSECASQDQAEEERRRRESFELMRKEQHKSLQEKQNLTTNKLEKDHASNITELVGESDGGNKALTKLAELDESMTQAVSNNLSSKPSLQTSVARPLVPPGFRSTVVEKNSITLAHSSALEAGKPDVEERNSHAKAIVPTGIPVANQEESINPSTQAQQQSILDKLFGSVLSDDLGGSSVLVEKMDTGQDDPWTPPDVFQSSKFAQWFLEDEKKGTEDLSHTKTNDLLSLIGGGTKGGSQAFNVKSPQHIPADFSFPSSEITDGHSTSDTMPSSVEVPKKLYKSGKEETAPPILTCEDLEQTILSGYSGSSSTSQQTLQAQNIFGPGESKPETDNGASLHLLSLLKKGPVLKDTMVSPITESGFSGEKVENVAQSGKPLTLETLFGSAFMKELQSAEAPVSALGSAVKSNIIDESNKQQSKSDNFRSLFGIYDTQVESDSSKHQTDIFSKPGGFDGAADIQLPEEESLIAVGDPVNTRTSMFNSFGNLFDGESQSSNRTLDISDKLAALTTGFKDERPLMRGRHGSLDRETFHNLQAQSSSPRFNSAPQMNHASPFLHPLESHPTHASPPLNFNAHEDMLQRGGPRNHQFPVNVMRPPFRHPSEGQAGFDPPHPILQQMHMQMQMQRPTPNNLPHHLQEYNRGAPLPLHLRTHAAGPMQERNPMQGFPFDQQEVNVGGPGMTMQAPEVRGSHPEAFQKLLEMELRANSSKRMHPFSSLGSDQGLHGRDLDLSFRYR